MKDKLLDLARRDRECSEALVASWGREPGWAFLVEQAHRLGDELDRAIDENLSWLELEAEASLRHFSQQLFAARTELTVAAGLGDADRFGRTALWRARAAVLRTRHEVEPIVARCLVGT